MVEPMKQILVVDDDENIAHLLKKVLEGQYSVDCCYSLADALTLYDENSYDLIITDLQLGPDSGMNLARYVREKDPYVEVIIITGHASVESAREAVDLGIVSYLTKPIDIAELRVLVERSVLSHSFNSKSKEYALTNNLVTDEMRTHMRNVLTLYNFISKLNQTVELIDTVQVLLKEILMLLDAEFCMLGTSCLGFEEIYVYTEHESVCNEDCMRSVILENWSGEFANVGLSKDHLLQGFTPVNYVGKTCNENSGEQFKVGKPFIIPLSSYGENFGVIAVFGKSDLSFDIDEKSFFFAMSPLIAPPIYRGYIEKKTKEQAQTDGLTGIANRRALQDALNRDVQRSVRYERPLSVIMMDIDNFKMVNDTYGHLTGDEVLRDLTGVVNHVIRGSDFFGRYGGEEFVVVLPDTAREGAVHLAERIREVIDLKVCTYEEVSLNYTVSVGVAIFDPTDVIQGGNIEWKQVVEKLLKRVDTALYKAKESGKNCVVVAE